MSKVIAYKNKAGKFNITIVGDDPTENLLLATNQGFERKAGVKKCLAAAYQALYESLTYEGFKVEYMTHAEYQAFLRQRRRGKK